MPATRQALIRGAIVGGLIGLPMGILAGIFFAHMVLGDDLSGRGIVFIALVTIAFIAWAAFLGAMLKLQHDEPN